MNRENENLDISPTKSDYRKAMSENLHGCDINNVRVLSYQNKAPAPPEVLQLKQHYTLFHERTILKPVNIAYPLAATLC